MAFSIVHGDIVQMETDAIVNAANSGLLAGSGVCGAIFHAVGPRARELQEACLAQAPCPTGQSVLTDSYGLKAKYIIHTVGPIWQGGQRGRTEPVGQLLCHGPGTGSVARLPVHRLFPSFRQASLATRKQKPWMSPGKRQRLS